MKSSGELEKEFVDHIVERTGKDLPTWLGDIKSSGISKRNDIIQWLKKEHGFRYVNATWLAGIYLNKGKMVYQDEGQLLEDQLVNREALAPLFNELKKFILSAYPHTKMIPKKTYVSFTAKREFVAVNIKSNEIRVGLDLAEDQAFNESVQKARLTGPMPRLSHMVVLVEKGQLDNSLLSLVKKSYERVN